MGDRHNKPSAYEENRSSDGDGSGEQDHAYDSNGDVTDHSRSNTAPNDISASLVVESKCTDDLLATTEGINTTSVASAHEESTEEKFAEATLNSTDMASKPLVKADLRSIDAAGQCKKEVPSSKEHDSSDGVGEEFYDHTPNDSATDPSPNGHQERHDFQPARSLSQDKAPVRTGDPSKMAENASAQKVRSAILNGFAENDGERKLEDIRKEAQLFYDENAPNHPLSKEINLQYVARHNKHYAIKCIEGNRIVAHRRVVEELIPHFLSFKRERGSDIEQAFYKDKIKTEDDFLKHLIRDRPLSFIGPNDFTLIIGNERPSPREWDLVGGGRAQEGQHLSLGPYLSYDEMQISALIGVSSPTVFLNEGERQNRGRKRWPNGHHEKYGIYVGLVGARFERYDRMESQYCLVTRQLSTSANGYGLEPTNIAEAQRLRLFARFFGFQHPESNHAVLPTFDEVSRAIQKNPALRAHYKPIGNDVFLNVAMLRKRLDASGDPAAASCSVIGEVQNPYINKELKIQTLTPAFGSQVENFTAPLVKSNRSK
ncbi:hypothetical protein HDU96_005291 [Phlyctochytrium bullatum]|nr:hypothetical protein HDU96_005291 [Phlyctochytrium bullatum]